MGGTLLQKQGDEWVVIGYHSKMHALTTGSATVNLSWLYSGFNSTSLLFGTGCVDGSGSLSGGAFNQLKLVTLSVI